MISTTQDSHRFRPPRRRDDLMAAGLGATALIILAFIICTSTSKPIATIEVNYPPPGRPPGPPGTAAPPGWHVQLSFLSGVAGTYAVGSEVQPGTYHSSRPAADCYWARLSSVDNENEIVDERFGDGSTPWTVYPNDVAITVRNCGPLSEISSCPVPRYGVEGTDLAIRRC
jgi:hypothetical protein